MIIKSCATQSHGAYVAKTRLNAHSIVIPQDETMVMQVPFLRGQTRLFYQKVKKILTIQIILHLLLIYLTLNQQNQSKNPEQTLFLLENGTNLTPKQ